VKIFKYALQIEDEQTVELPLCSTILFTGANNGELCIWVQVLNPNAAKKPHKLFIHGTGREINGMLQKKYLGSVVMEPFVWHVFLEVPRG